MWGGPPAQVTQALGASPQKPAKCPREDSPAMQPACLKMVRKPLDQWKVPSPCHRPLPSVKPKSQLLRLADQRPAIWGLVPDSLWIYHRPGCQWFQRGQWHKWCWEDIDPPADGWYWLTQWILTVATKPICVFLYSNGWQMRRFLPAASHRSHDRC